MTPLYSKTKNILLYISPYIRVGGVGRLHEARQKDGRRC